MGIMLTAYDKGLATCWVGAFDNEAVQRVLDIPENQDPQIIISLGYADEIKKPSQREDPRYLTYFNSWGSGYTKFPSHLEKLKDRIKKGKKK
jgi:nitroreductase